MRKTLLFYDEASQIIGAAIEVHKTLGPGFLEAVYQEALERELGAREIPFRSQQQLVIFYKGKPLRKRYVADFVCYNKIIVEIKAIRELAKSDKAQVVNYLKATGFKLGFLFNFGSNGKLEFERIIA